MTYSAIELAEKLKEFGEEVMSNHDEVARIASSPMNDIGEGDYEQEIGICEDIFREWGFTFISPGDKLPEGVPELTIDDSLVGAVNINGKVVFISEEMTGLARYRAIVHEMMHVQAENLAKLLEGLPFPIFERLAESMVHFASAAYFADEENRELELQEFALGMMEFDKARKAGGGFLTTGVLGALLAAVLKEGASIASTLSLEVGFRK